MIITILKAFVILILGIIELKKFNNKSFRRAFVVLSLLVTMPIFFQRVNSQYLLNLTFVSVLWLVYCWLNNKWSKILVYALILATSVMGTLYLNGLVDNRAHWNYERTIVSDSHYYSKLTSVRNFTLFIPYSLRKPLLTNIPVAHNLIGRTLKWSWFDWTIDSLGLAVIYPLVLGILDKKSRNVLLPIFLVFFSGSIARNPENTSMHITALPLIIFLVITGSHKINIRTLTLLSIWGLITRLATL